MMTLALFAAIATLSVTPTLPVVPGSLREPAVLFEASRQQEPGLLGSAFRTLPRLAATDANTGTAVSAPRRGLLRRHPVVVGALIGAGAGVVTAMTLENELFCSGGDEDCFFHGGSRVGIGAGLGAGVGALVGWIASAGSH